ncbi:MAG TPA: hypothetical protein VF278_21480 [Pirellulales bacterium]
MIDRQKRRLAALLFLFFAAVSAANGGGRCREKEKAEEGVAVTRSIMRSTGASPVVPEQKQHWPPVGP